jgi:hypothetical protein
MLPSERSETNSESSAAIKPSGWATISASLEMKWKYSPVVGST